MGSPPFPAGVDKPYVVILTALSKECRAVCDLLKRRQDYLPDSTVYSCGVLDCGQMQLNVAVAEVGQGNAFASAEVVAAKAAFDPACLLFVGVAGGLKDVTLGDAVCADKVHSYERGKEGENHLVRQESFPVPRILEQVARGVARTNKWASPKKPTAFIGPIVTGEKVLANREGPVYKLVREHFSDALAVEMEGTGFMAGAHVTNRQLYGVIRGISDLVEGKQAADESGGQERAAKTAANFAVSLLRQLVELKVIRPTVHEVTKRELFDLVLPDGLSDEEKSIAAEKFRTLLSELDSTLRIRSHVS